MIQHPLFTPARPIILHNESKPYDWNTRAGWQQIGYKVSDYFASPKPVAYIYTRQCGNIPLYDMDQVDIIQTSEAYRKRLKWLDNYPIDD